MSVGERLRQARLEAGKTLEQIAAETKIQLWILEAIERDDFSRVPGGIFIRGYLTAIARAVALPPSELLTAYAPQVPPLPAAPAVPVPPPDLNERPATPLWHYVAIVAMVVTAAVLWRNTSRNAADVTTATTAPPAAAPAPARPPSLTPTSPPASAPREPGATATTGAASPGVPADAGDVTGAVAAAAPLVVQLHANDEVWVEASADGARKAYQLFEEGQDLRLEAHNEIRLLVGDAAAVTYTINGKPGRRLGGTGAVRQFVVSPDTVASLTGVL